MRHLWLRGFTRLEMLKSQVDDSGHDLILEANTIARHIQLKASHRGSATSRVNVNDALARKPSGCVIWMSLDPATLEFDHVLWFGGSPGSKLPDLIGFPKATHTKRNARGEKTERPNIRIVAKTAFVKLDAIDDLVVRLFGAIRSDEAQGSAGFASDATVAIPRRGVRADAERETVRQDHRIGASMSDAEAQPLS